MWYLLCLLMELNGRASLLIPNGTSLSLLVYSYCDKVTDWEIIVFERKSRKESQWGLVLPVKKPFLMKGKTREWQHEQRNEAPQCRKQVCVSSGKE